MHLGGVGWPGGLQLPFCHCGNSSGKGAQELNEAAGAAKTFFFGALRRLTQLA
jgi:hypothetical protein